MELLRLEDNGLSFEQSRTPQLLAMFRRLPSHVAGAGVGPYVVKCVVNNVGSRPGVENQLGQNPFLVYLYLPLPCPSHRGQDLLYSGEFCLSQ
ncbi:hypothetical protein GCM10011378_07690 [Hymenobacter glacieicola]|uniref:Uncharacterized protein n=1 Tax=Hymenobacter glacieicola TaxID=1562124 RepID=A0ABQ1WK66_9BACT|nr:hypothetical protein GCM10011378_07690 [Hymenobacter glacieicola]